MLIFWTFGVFFDAAFASQSSWASSFIRFLGITSHALWTLQASVASVFSCDIIGVPLLIFIGGFEVDSAFADKPCRGQHRFSLSLSIILNRIFRRSLFNERFRTICCLCFQNWLLRNLPWPSCRWRGLVWCPLSFHLFLLAFLVFVDSLQVLISASSLCLILVFDHVQIAYLFALVFNSGLQSLSLILLLLIHRHFSFVCWPSMAAVATDLAACASLVEVSFTVLKSKMKTAAVSWLLLIEFWIDFETR